MEIAKTIAPFCLALIMFGLGLGLRTEDFLRVVKKPRDFIIGPLASQRSLGRLSKFFAAAIKSCERVGGGSGMGWFIAEPTGAAWAQQSVYCPDGIYDRACEPRTECTLSS